MTSQLIIRDALPSDVPALVPLLIELGYPVEPEVLAQRFETFTALGESALVAQMGTRLVGLLTLHVTNVLHRVGSVGRITTLVVLQEAQRTGVGHALVAEAEMRLWARGCVLIEVTSNKTRKDAHTFYERLGYEQTSYRFGKTQRS